MRKLLFVSLGCDKNLVDSERMISILTDKGFRLTDEETQAEVIVINTCCFIHDAKEESIENILSMSEMKKNGCCKVLVITGCMAQMYADEITREIPEVDAVIGTENFDCIADAVEAAYAKQKTILTDLTGKKNQEEHQRISVTGGFTEYLKIAEGCDKRCTYCVIPSLRGRFRSIPIEQLIKEARSLASRGTKELILVAQETTLYGMDLYGEKRLHVLLKELCRIKELSWIRLMYCYPEEIYPELTQTIAEEKKICNYLDMPIQHCSDAILKKMGRKTTKKDLLSIIETLRAKIPGITLRTSLISGFPSETEEQHKELLEFVREIRFDRLGVFTYSREDGTPAARMHNQVPEEIKIRRRDEIMTAQQEISEENGRDKIGSRQEVFIEGYLPEDDVYAGRTRADAPDVDGYIFVESERSLNTGDIIECLVTDAEAYDLIGTAVESMDD